MDNATISLRKQQSHGRIGEAAVSAKCWMHGIPAYNTGGLRANFAGSDLIIDTPNPKIKKLVQVKTGYAPANDKVYLTQCKGEIDLEVDKFVADFVVFVNIEKKIASTHSHDGAFGFEHLEFYIVPQVEANAIYKAAVHRDYAKPLKTGGRRKLGNMSVVVTKSEMSQFLNAWQVMRVTHSAA
jgi:hypothetical protein